MSIPQSVAGFFKRFTSSSSDNGPTKLSSRNSSPVSKPKKRDSFPVVEVVIPTTKSLSAGTRTPTSSHGRSPGSDRGPASASSIRPVNINGTSGSRLNSGVPATSDDFRSESPELPPSPSPPTPKRARFDDTVQYQTVQQHKAARPPPSKTSVLPARTNGRPSGSGPTRPMKRKRSDQEEEENDISAELEVAPSISVQPAKKPLHVPAPASRAVPYSGRKLPDFTNSNKKAVSAAASPIASSSRAPIVFEVEDSSSESDEVPEDRGTSPELPEILPTTSPKKVGGKVDTKGKGKAMEPATASSAKPFQKAKAWPVESEFRFLEELADFDPDVRPTYALWVLARCAILGSGIDKLALEGVISRVCERYVYYRYLAYESGSEERIRLSNAFKAAMASKLCFVITREHRGSAWYGVDKHVNPALKRPPAVRNPRPGPTKDGSSATPLLPGTSTAIAIAATTSGSSKPSAVPQAVPRLPPPPPVPEFVIHPPGKLPSAEIDMFATSLSDLKNALLLDDSDDAPTNSGKPPGAKGADGGKTVQPVKVTHAAVMMKRIPYELWTPIRAAILGSPFRKLRLKALLEDVRWKYPQLAPPTDTDALSKLQRTVQSTLYSKPCFFRVIRDGNRNTSFWMVDPGIDPRLKKKKLKWSNKTLNEADVIKHTVANALALSMNPDLPPSAAALLTPAEQSKLGLVDEEILSGLGTAVKELDELHDFYRERAEKWDRRLAYVHESEVVVRKPVPEPLPANALGLSDAVEEDERASFDKEPSPELEEIVSQRKTLSSSNGGIKPSGNGSIKPSSNGGVKPISNGIVKAPSNSAKPTHPLAKQIFHQDIVDSSDEEEETAAATKAAQVPASYVCGYSDTRTGILCESRFTSRDERETHQRFVHGVKNNTYSAQSRFSQEAKLKVKKDLEQARVNKKIQGKRGKKTLASDGHGMLARQALHSKFGKTKGAGRK